MPDYLVDPQERGFGPPNMAAQLFGMISNVPNAYQQGAENQFKRGQQARTEKLQEPVLGPNGEPVTDYSTLLREYTKRSGPTPELLSLLQGQEANEMIGRALGGDGGGGGSPYSPSNPNMTPDAHTGRAGRVGQNEQPDGPAGEDTRHQNVRQLAENAGIDPNSPDFKQAFAGTNIDRDFTTSGQADGAAARIKMLGELQTKGAARLAEMQGTTAALGGGATAGPAPAPQGAPPMQMAQAGPAPGGPGTPVGTEAQARAYEEQGKRIMAVSAARGAAPAAAAAAQKTAESYFARAKDIRDTLAKYAEPTTAQKEAPRGMSVQEAAAHAEGLKKTAEAKSKNVAGYIDAVRPARQTIQVLDEMDNALTQGWNNISTGPGARQWLEVKKAVNNVAPGTFAHVAEAETIDKLNAQLAAAAAKAMTARPSQLEFKAFMANNPGLLTSRETSRGLIDLMRQAKQQEVELGQLADKFTPGAGKSWSDTEAEYQRTHAIISPFTHKPVDAKQAADGKWYRPDPDRPGKFMMESGGKRSEAPAPFQVAGDMRLPGDKGPRQLPIRSQKSLQKALDNAEGDEDLLKIKKNLERRGYDTSFLGDIG